MLLKLRFILQVLKTVLAAHQHPSHRHPSYSPLHHQPSWEPHLRLSHCHITTLFFRFLTAIAIHCTTFSLSFSFSLSSIQSLLKRCVELFSAKQRAAILFILTINEKVYCNSFCSLSSRTRLFVLIPRCHLNNFCSSSATLYDVSPNLNVDYFEGFSPWFHSYFTTAHTINNNALQSTIELASTSASNELTLHAVLQIDTSTYCRRGTSAAWHQRLSTRFSWQILSSPLIQRLCQAHNYSTWDFSPLVLLSLPALNHQWHTYPQFTIWRFPIFSLYLLKPIRLSVYTSKDIGRTVNRMQAFLYNIQGSATERPLKPSLPSASFNPRLTRASSKLKQFIPIETERGRGQRIEPVVCTRSKPTI